MKKFYSLVLMAAALLIGTNVWAGNVTGNNRAALQAAIDGAASGTTLTLQNDFTLDGPVWLGTADLDGENGAYKSIILDLNGHKISMAAGGDNAYMFVLTHGELLVRNSSATQALIEVTGNTGSNMNTQVFTVFGTYRSSRWNEAGTAADDTHAINTRNQGWFSHLELGTNVKIITNSGVMGTGIAVDELFATEGAIAKIAALGHTINYTTNVLETASKKADRGLAQGVKVDVYGDIEIPGKGVANQANKAYCIKVNGMVDKPHSNNLVNKAAPFADVDYVQNYVQANHQGDTVDIPFIYVHSTAKLVSDNKSTRSTAVYSSGYSKMLIEGYCEGAVGVYASSGVVELNDAEVVSSSTTYTTPTADGGAQGGGSGLVVNSRDGYTGEVSVIVTGDSKITATTGYAIEEIVTSSDTSKVKDVTIEGGTIEGGNKGAIVVSNETATSTNANVTVYGGNVTGNTQVGTSGTITDILPKDNNDQATAHVTVITDPETGKTTLVVSDGATAPAAQTEWTDIMALASGADVNWTGTTAGQLGDGTAVTTKTLGELQMISGTSANPQQLTVKKNATLNVDHLVMNKYAQIVVEPGAKFIVTGEQGIVAPETSNIILKTSDSEHAIFLFNPAVSSNRHPNATVEFTSKSYTKTSSDWAKQIFGIPTNTKLSEITTKYAGSDVATGFEYFDYADASWKTAGYVNVAGKTMDYEKIGNPFTYYRMQHNTPNVGTVVTMKGELTGNTDAQLNVLGNFWCGYANSYMAPINGETFIQNLLDAGTVVDKAYYLYYIDEETSQWGWWEQSLLDNANINPMQPFLLRNPNEAANVTVDYAEAVYYNLMPKPSPAPARHQNNNITKAKVIVRGEGNVDRIVVAEGEEFTAEFDNGYDVVKYMNEGIKLYVSANEKMGIFATDNLENTYVGFQAINGGTYTIEFAGVQGEELTLVDLETGARVAMIEGNTYEFTANEANDYRFQITKISKVATDIENTEAVKSATGIYTITGQYMGEMNVWNTLPAGVYVVNGEKRVK